MGDELPKPASTLTGAVFLSYASQDTAAAERIATALRSAGIEVWFDKSELRGGDLWDRQIRAQIHKCRLFIPIVSGSTDARVEGYFRREWRLAVDRTRDLSERISFLVPVVIDSTSELRADVPDAFRNVQWTRLPGGETPSAFPERVRQLLTGDLPSEPAAATKTPAGSSFAQISTSLSGAHRGHKLSVWLLGAVIAVGVAYLSVDRFWLSRHTASSSATSATVANDPVAFTVPEKSIAVLPFIDMSEKHDQEYFSDGLAEELLDLLAKTPGLHVIARTSSFSLKGKSDDIPTIGARLRVANILEGSVRKSGENLRVTTQLVRADTAEHLWSETYEVTSRDIFKVQDEIAGAVVSVLKLKLVQGQRTAGTANPAAYNEYLLARQHQRRETKEEFQRAIAAYQRAVALDPHYVAAIAGLASAEYRLADITSDSTGFKVARSHAAQAIFEGPGEAEGYAVRGGILSRVDWDWVDALADLQRAVALNPGDAGIQRSYGELLGLLGRFPEATAALNMATRLDPLSSAAWDDLGLVLMASRDYRNARQAFGRELEIQPEDPYALDNLGTLQLITHDPAAALATYLRISEAPLRDTGVALAEHSLGHEQQSQRALEGAIAEGAQGFASQIADAFAWCGQGDEAFAWLERAREQHDGGLAELNTDVLLASLHDDPRYRKLRHNINLPD